MSCPHAGVSPSASQACRAVSAVTNIRLERVPVPEGLAQPSAPWSVFVHDAGRVSVSVIHVLGFDPVNLAPSLDAALGHGQAEALREHGADIVVEDLAELLPES